MRIKELIEDRVLVVMDPQEGITEGGIIIPETAQERATLGEVEGRGPETSLEIMEGDRVYVNPASGTAINMDGRYYVIIREGAILARLD